MATLDLGQMVEVNAGPCRCSGGASSPHPDGDVVWLKPVVDLPMGLAASSAFNSATNRTDMIATMFTVYVTYGVVAWNVRDEKGPVPVSAEAVLARLTWAEGGKLVADRAADLYTDQVLDPLRLTRSKPQPSTGANGSISPNPSSGRKSRTSSRPSSPSTPVAGT